ncbi:MAG: hypothetical protein EXR62_10805 [Chloroflexi bacterium]|nr:hypothetical protein [Chloroflexota bacterium]
MLSEIRKRKIKRLIDSYDFDGNGYVEKGDFEQLFQRLATNLGLAPGSQEYHKMHGITMAGWDGVKEMADFNHDDKVTYEEYFQAVDAVTANRDIFARLALGITDSSFSMQDTNGDGQISGEESIAYTSSYNMTKADAATAFAHLDRNGDGFITRDEMLENVTDFFLSEDQNSPGNWLMGPF